MPVIFSRLKMRLPQPWPKLEFLFLLGRAKVNKISGGALNNVSPPLDGNQILYWTMEAMLPISCLNIMNPFSEKLSVLLKNPLPVFTDFINSRKPENFVFPL